LALVLVAALTALAGALAARRDLGAGLLPTGRGPATAAAWLGSPLALAWRLQRGLFTSWLAGFVALGVVLGGVANSITDLAGDNQQMHDIIVRMGGAQALTDSYLAGMASLLGLIAAGYAVQAVLKLQDEEASGRAEPLLSAPVSRLGWAGSHLVFAALGPAVVLAAGGLAMGLAYGLSAGDVPAQLPRVLGGALAQLPAVWTLAALAVALLGLRPRLAALSWGALGLCLLVLLVSGLRLSHWATAASPFTHVPRLPGGPFTATPLAALLAVALALAAAGLSGLRRRDMPVT
jgi:ABC-2 type transport system permease protein